MFSVHKCQHTIIMFTSPFNTAVPNTLHCVSIKTPSFFVCLPGIWSNLHTNFRKHSCWVNVNFTHIKTIKLFILGSLKSQLWTMYVLMIIEFFTSCYGWGVIGSNIEWKSAFLKGVWSIWPKISGRKGSRHQPIFVSEN